MRRGLTKIQWNKNHQKRFCELVGKEAMNTASSVEKVELECLQERRRWFMPPSEQELACWHKNRIEVAQTMDALKKLTGK